MAGGTTIDPDGLDDIGPVSRFVRQLPNPVVRFRRCSNCGSNHFYVFVQTSDPGVYAKVEPFPYDLSRGPTE